jgi:hypothetical protein
MDLHEYPRPTNDTGIGVHWCAGISHIDAHQLRSFWIPELRELGVSWVKIADHRGALPLVEDLLRAQIMPVVQIYRPGLAAGHLTFVQLQEVEDLISAGVRYFEFNSRPDAVQRWPRQQLPPDALAQVAEHTAIDMLAILERGGLPAIPALAPQTAWDLVEALIERGHADLLDGPVWQAIHNFGSNRPLNYPYDPASREGAPLTQEYYTALLQESWDGDAWQGRDLETINQLRRQHRQQQGTARLDLPFEQRCWLSYEGINARNQAHLDRVLPILSTAGGWIVDTAEDPRYPAVTPLLHMAQTLEACRTMMGTSRRYPPAPDFYFCTAFWLLANEALASDLPAPSTQCWYSQAWPQQALPIVPALKVEAKRSRLPQRMFTTDDRARTLAADMVVASSQPNTPRNSMIAGHVRGGANADLWLVRADGMLYRTLARPDGSYRFVGLARGRYTLWVNHPPGSRRENIDLDGHNHVEVRLTVDRWGYELVRLDQGGTPLLRCRVESSAVTAESGTLAIRLRRSDDPGGQGGRVVNMARRVDGVAVCEIAPLASGEYRVEVLGITTAHGDPYPLDALISINGAIQLSFIYNRPVDRGFLRYSQIYGHVTNGAGGQIALLDTQGKRWLEVIDDEEHYVFEHLPSGIYTLSVVDHEQAATRNRLALDGKNQLQCDFVLYIEPAQDHPVVDSWGRVELTLSDDGDLVEAGSFSLIGESGDVYVPTAVVNNHVWFDQIPPGVYTFSGDGYWQPGLEVFAEYHLSVDLPSQSPLWECDISEIATIATTEGIRVQVLGRHGVTVHLSDEDGVKQVTQTGSAADQAFSAQFEPLQPGRYELALEEMDVQTSVNLAAQTRVVVRFWRSGALGGALKISYNPLSLESD